MKTTPKKQALARYRERLSEKGMARFEVLGLETDRELIPSLARRLASNDADSAGIRTTVRACVLVRPTRKGGILEALRRSPMVGAELNLERPTITARGVDL